MKYLYAFLLLSNCVLAQGTKDKFVGEVVTQWLDNGRTMKLIQEFAYIDPNGKQWNVPKNTIVDGASIPRIFWTIIGGPFEGTYRNASVIHDYYCVTKTEPWQNVHLMFYNACITGGTSVIQAKIMYAAVYSGGPRWKKVKLKNYSQQSVDDVIVLDTHATTSDDKLKEITEWIEKTNPTLQEINIRLNKVIVEKI